MKTTNYFAASLPTAWKACLLFAAVLALGRASSEGRAPALPPNWDVSGEWQFTQDASKPITMKLSQTGSEFTGKATSGEPGSQGYAQGKVDGTVSGDTFSAMIRWGATIVTKKDVTVLYIGEITSDGTVKGKMQSVEKDPKFPVVSFSSLTAMKRLHSNPEDTSGKQRQSGTSAPSITASPDVVKIPAGQSEGTTTLTWDGGSNHPHAEVWVKVNEHEKKFVAGESKGSRQMPVKPGKTYVYVLKDSGQKLNTVTVRAE